MAKRWRFQINGTVQGVGFRPFIFNLARKNELSGFVQNNSDGVLIEIQSLTKDKLEKFWQEMLNDLPPLAKVNQCDKEEIDAVKEEIGFQIQNTKVKKYRTSSDPENNSSFANLPPCDSTTCKDCLQELFDKNNRRYRYPFINCVNCGPRFTIIKELPYDRTSTTMSNFVQCKECLDEYNNPTDRRFHAQPNACAKCGPQVSLEPPNLYDETALKNCIELLNEGKIIALKGLGGFQLLCDASNEKSVALLRERKQRPHKPLAVMFKNINQLKKQCHTNEVEESLLLAKESPIVLLTKKKSFSLASNLCFENNKLGAMLPVTALHHLLLADFNGPLVATSGNTSEEPIAFKNDEARVCLSKIADAFLLNNRDIISRYDDSVLFVHDQKPIMIRRARGFSPFVFDLSFNSRKQILALGGHLKNTFCFSRGNQTILSQHLGDLDNTKSLDNLTLVLDHYQKMFDYKPDIVAHDLHPDYMSTALAKEISKESNIKTIAVQHHHAHIAACMVEHKLQTPVIGIALDGLGMGLDDTLWGGEFLYCSLGEGNDFKRLAHFKPVLMPGGTAAIKEPWRMMLGLIESFEDSNKQFFESFVEKLIHTHSFEKIKIIKKQIEQKFNSPLTSSCGRLFDALAALLDICSIQTFEGQAPQALESLAYTEKNTKTKAYSFCIKDQSSASLIDMENVFVQIVKDLHNQVSPSLISLKFHHTIKNALIQICRDLSKKTDCRIICLSGGVFQNRLLLNLVEQDLKNENFQVYYPQKIPANDGGLALGQLVVAANSI
ncbi:MAG: carbamoyltransferase HypF [Candidatus Melainabacteria bacterium]|nr:carbamoyltransferase HypF [Candidatus Melainabacteria bacterium]